MVERIEIVRGPASALYGDGAVGGVLHIRTRPLEGPPRAAVRGLYGRYDTAGGSLRAAGTFADWTAGLFVDGLVTDGYRDNSAFDSQDVKGSLETTLFDRVVVGSSGGRHYDDRELPGGLTFAQIDALGRRASDPVLAENRGDVESWFWDGWVEASLAPEVELRLLPYFFHRDDFTRIAFTNVGPEPSVPFDIDGEKRQGGVDLQLRVDRPLFGLANRLIVGATYLHDEVDRSSVSGAFFSQRAVGERDVSGGFAQEELWLREDLLLAAGVRYDDGSYRLRLTDRLSGQTARDDPDLDAWSPKASLTWRFLPVASAYFSWARGFRLPDFDEDLPILNFDGSTTLPDLGVQRSEAFELGSKLEAKDLSAGVALYWMRVRDEILFDPEPPPGGFFGENVNLDRVRHRGVELSGSWRVLPWLTLAGGYTFDDVKVLDDDDATIEGSRMPITPRHRGNLAAVAELPLGFEPLDVELGANANLVGKRIVANDFQRELSQLDAYETLDLWLRLRPQLGERVAATLSFAVRNVTGERYEDYANCRGCPLRPFFPVPEAVVYPAARRSYEVGLLVELRP
jgi:iron complex outermembrane receptor protein